MPRNTTQYTLAGPRTFRRGSRKLWKKWGSNVQNIAKNLRNIYIPDGYKLELEAKCRYWLETGDDSIFTEEQLVTLRVFLQTDQSGAEALIVAYDCEAKDYRQLFINNVKPHVFVALKLFKDIWPKKASEHRLGLTQADVELLCNTKIPELKLNPHWREIDKLIKDSDNWPISERYYYLAKQTCHSANYGIEWAMFQLNVLEKSGGKIVLTKEDSRFFLETYRGLFQEIPDRCRRVREQVDRVGILYNLHGHPLQITNYNITEATYKEYYAWGPQSTVGEITRIAASNLQAYIEQEKKPWDILQDNHDSLLTQGPLLDVKDRAAKMKEFFAKEMVSPVDGVKFRMKSETAVGFNWGPHKEEDNKLGLRELQ